MMEEQPKATGAQGKIIEHLTGRVSDTPPVEAPMTLAAVPSLPEQSVRVTPLPAFVKEGCECQMSASAWQRLSRQMTEECRDSYSDDYDP
jgi:hypothetical protein